jgi:thioredoxin-like negative regulator of GroEL
VKDRVKVVCPDCGATNNFPLDHKGTKVVCGRCMVLKINVDQNPQTAAQFAILGVPTFVIVFNGHERGRTSGAMSEADLALWVASRI